MIAIEVNPPIVGDEPELTLRLIQTAPIYRAALTANQLVLVADGGAGGYTYAATGLPAGLTLNTATGEITGTPTTIAHSVITASVTDSASTTVTATFSIDVVTRLSGSTVTPAVCEQMVAYTYTFAVSGATGTVTWSVSSGALPAGITLSSAGVLSGTATVSGTFAFTVLASDAGTGDVATFAVAAFVVAPPLGLGNYWIAAASMASVHRNNTTTKLASGLFLAVGGTDFNGTEISTCELYDPTENTWTAAGSLATARTAHCTVLLSTNKVLVVGGADISGVPLATCELYDPTTNTWTAAAPMNSARMNFALIALDSGKVLAISGENEPVHLTAACELYDPTTNTWTAAGSVATARQGFSAVLLNTGKVLVIGGLNATATVIASCELYDPLTDTWGATGSMASVRYGNSATLLNSGNVLCAAGQDSFTTYLATCEIYSATAGTWSAAASLTTARSAHTATLLASNKVLLAGGFSIGQVFASCAQYDETTNLWVSVGPLAQARSNCAAVLLSNGDALVVGGNTATCEKFVPDSLSPLIAVVGSQISLNMLDTFAHGGVAPYAVAYVNWTGGIQPPGLTFGSNGTITGIPTATIIESVTVTYTDAIGATASATLQITISNSLMQLQLAKSNIGPIGPSVINFEFPATGTPDVTNDGTTMTVTIPTAPDSGYDATVVHTTRTVNGHALSADVNVTKADVGLGSVDNTSDLSKPVSTATQAALDLKQDTLVQAGATHDGYLSHTDWGTFNAKQNALGFTPVRQGGVTGMGGNRIYIGWSGSQALIQVDNSPLGALCCTGLVNTCTQPQYLSTSASSALIMATSSSTASSWIQVGNAVGFVGFGNDGTNGYLYSSTGVVYNYGNFQVENTLTAASLSLTGTTSQYVRGDGSLATFPSGGSGTVTSVTAGNGMTFTNITTSGAVALGTPSSCSPSTSNNVTSNSHTHALTGVASPPTTCTASTGNTDSGSSHTHNITGFLPLTGGTLTDTLTGTTIQASTIKETSDARFKSNVRDLSDALEIVRGLMPRRFYNTLTEDEEVGLIAQEVRDYLPEVISTDDNGDLAVSYQRVVAPLIGAVHALDARLKRLEALLK